MITRIYTDVTGATLQDVIFEIEADGGTFERVPQPDGTDMIVAQFPGDPPPPAVPAAGGGFPWMPIALGERGVKEGHNLRITEYFKSTTLGAQPDTVPWCSAFANFCVTQSGVTGTDSALARSWLTWGVGTDVFVPGCIVVLARGGPETGHVAFYFGPDGADRVQLLGGNQHDSVNVTSYQVKTVVGKRVPAEAMPVAAPLPGAGAAMNLDSVRADRRSMAQHVIDAFASAGFLKVQQATALANAIAESGLDPNAHATSGEDSVGLFQLNRRGGLGTGHTVSELMDPDQNIAIIIDQARKVAAFVNSQTIEDAVAAFVREIERPRDKEGEITNRLQIAQRLLS